MLVTARVLRAAGLVAAICAMLVVGAVMGRATASAILPDLDELSLLADDLAPADAEAVVAHDASRAGPQNLNVFMPPTPGSAHRSWDPARDVVGDVERVGNDLRGLGWHEIEGARGDRTFASGFRRASVGAAGDGSVELTLTWDRGWVLFLPSATALLAAAVLLVGVGRRRRGRGATSLGPGAMP